MTHVVSAPLVCGKDEAGNVQYLYQGTAVRDLLTDSEIERLASMGMLTPLVPVLDAPEPVVDAVSARPSRVAAKAAWVEYAVEQGMSREDAEASTRDQLAEQYGV